MKLILLSVLLLSIITAGTATSGGFKVAKVIEVGPAAWVPFSGPLRWSPDGTKLAYFAHNYLMISDTLGNSRQVMKVDSGITPHRLEWVSNDEIAVNTCKRYELDSRRINTLTVVNTTTGIGEVVAEGSLNPRRPSRASKAGEVYIDGPSLTTGGDADYRLKANTGRPGRHP